MATTNIILKAGDSVIITAENITPPVALRTFYVSAQGSDSNNGISTATPWKTISKVNSTMFQPGDAIRFRKGDIFTGNLQISSSGTAASPIAYNSYGTGDTPEITNNGSFWIPSIAVTGRQYVIIDGFKIIDKTISATDHNIQAKFAYGIVVNNSPNCVVKNCDISLVGCGMQIIGSSNNTRVEKNFIHNTRMIVNTAGGDDDYGANGLIIATSNNKIIYNRFEECWANSRDYGYDGGAVEFYGSAVNGNRIEYNTAINCRGFLEIGSGSGGTANNNVIAYNKIINCGAIGFYQNSGSFVVSINNLQYYNNDVIETKQQYTVPGVLVACSGTATAGMIVMKNNIFWVTINTRIAETKFNVCVHTNNIYRMTAGSLGITKHASELQSSTATLFTSTSGDPSVWNYALPAGSPAINFGVNVGYTKDFIGNPIIGLPDAGILER